MSHDPHRHMPARQSPPAPLIGSISIQVSRMPIKSISPLYPRAYPISVISTWFALFVLYLHEFSRTNFEAFHPRSDPARSCYFKQDRCVSYPQHQRIGSNECPCYAVNLKHARAMILKAACAEAHTSRPDLIVLPVHVYLPHAHACQQHHLNISLHRNASMVHMVLYPIRITLKSSGLRLAARRSTQKNQIALLCGCCRALLRRSVHGSWGVSKYSFAFDGVNQSSPLISRIHPRERLRRQDL